MTQVFSLPDIPQIHSDLVEQPQKSQSKLPSNTFESWLAQYRARVYESLYFARQQPDYQTEVEQQVQDQGKKPLVLVIEDNVDQWFLIRWTLLRQFMDAETVWLSKAEQVTVYMEQTKRERNNLPNLILLDLYLPTAEEGLSILQAIKSDRLYQQTPVTVLSWSDDEQDVAQAFRRGGNAYIVKPIRYTDWHDAFSALNQYLSASLTNSAR